MRWENISECKKHSLCGGKTFLREWVFFRPPVPIFSDPCPSYYRDIQIVAAAKSDPFKEIHRVLSFCCIPAEAHVSTHRPSCRCASRTAPTITSGIATPKTRWISRATMECQYPPTQMSMSQPNCPNNHFRKCILFW